MQVCGNGSLQTLRRTVASFGQAPRPLTRMTIWTRTRDPNISRSLSNSALRSISSRSELSSTPPLVLARRGFCRFHRGHDADIVGGPTSTEMATQASDAYRLPTNVKPTHYDLTVRTDLEKEAFSGAVKIRYIQCLLCHYCDLRSKGSRATALTSSSQLRRSSFIRPRSSPSAMSR